MDNNWREQLKTRLEEERSEPSELRLKRLQALGIIDEKGQVTGHVHRWSAFLAVTGVKHSPDRGKILYYRCLKPVFGMPGQATIDIRRESMVGYLKAGKKVITANWDEALKMWREGADVYLTQNEFVRTDSNGMLEDNLGELPEFSPIETRP